jgi:hypothetical protein
MYELDIKRCPHCVGGLATVAIDDRECFETPGSALLCSRCDSAVTDDARAVVVPYWWD